MDNKNKVIVSLVIVIVCLIVGAGFGFYTILKNNPDNNSLKLDNDKDWIYAANYNLETNKDSYTTSGMTINAKDLIVPYININSKEAESANKEIYNLYKELIDDFNEYSKDSVFYTTVKYDKYINNDFISVVITTVSGGTDIPVYKYYTYNFNIKEGTVVSYKDAYNYVGLNENNINDNVKSSITDIMKKNYSGIDDFEGYKTKTINNYLSSLNNNQLNFYIDGSGKLNLVITFEFPIGRGAKEELVLVK